MQGLIAAALAVFAIQFACPTWAQQGRIKARLDPGDAQAVEASNRFALELYKRAGAGEANLFLSPTSVSTAMSLAYRGARGRTADQLRAVLHFPATPEAYLRVGASVLRSLDLSGAGRELRVSNALWVQAGLGLDAAFAADMARYAGAGLHRVDFRSDPNGARSTINRWVEARTHDRIKDLLQPDDVTKQTRVTLVNAIYWKGKWASPFAAGATRNELFTALTGRRMAMPLMHQQAAFRVAKVAGMKAIELAYVFDEIAMVILLPSDARALPRVERALDAGGLARWLHRLDAAVPRDTVLTMPKLHLEWRANLVPVLKALGATVPFGADADFSGMARPNEPGTLAIGSVIHQTFLDVDEDGSEAAAATAVGDVVITGRRIAPPPVEFRADKPFLFLLRDRRTGLILFMGRYVGPAGS